MEESMYGCLWAEESDCGWLKGGRECVWLAGWKKGNASFDNLNKDTIAVI